MRAYVFTDKALQRHAGQFVWLSLDVEKTENAVYQKRYGVDALPMFFVLDPKTEKVALRWVGGVTPTRGFARRPLPPTSPRAGSPARWSSRKKTRRARSS